MCTNHTGVVCNFKTGLYIYFFPIQKETIIEILHSYELYAWGVLGNQCALYQESKGLNIGGICFPSLIFQHLFFNSVHEGLLQSICCVFLK